LSVKPNAGSVAITIMAWNIAGSLNKRWLAQASPSTRSITYRIGDLTPNIEYVLLRNGIELEYRADSSGAITFTENNVSSAVVDYHLALTFDD
jgi:hypothetical protein